MQTIEQTLDKLGFTPYYQLPIVRTIATKTKLQPPVIVLSVLVVTTLLALSPIGGCIMTTLLAFLLPAFRTFEALESQSTQDDEQLLTYWIVFGVFYACNELFSYVFSFIPMFYLVRYVILLALYLPQVNGAQILYKRAIRPFFMSYRNEIEKVIQPIEEGSKCLSETIRRKTE